VEPLRKPVPVTERVKPAAPATAEDGLNDETVGAFTVNEAAVEEALPVFFTVTFTAPAPASWVAVTAAVTDVALLKVVVNAVDPHITVEPLIKLAPVTDSVKPESPATAEDGLRDETVGAFTVNEAAVEEALLVFFTVTLTEPAAAS